MMTFFFLQSGLQVQSQPSVVGPDGVPDGTSDGVPDGTSDGVPDGVP